MLTIIRPKNVRFANPSASQDTGRSRVQIPPGPPTPVDFYNSKKYIRSNPSQPPSRMQGHLIAIEGIDQSGKRTQAHLLSKTLRRKGLKVKILSFPIYSSRSGQQIREFLTGNRSYPAQAVHMMYSLNRWENVERIKRALSTCDYVIADRYSPSNLAYGVSRGLNFEWLKDLDKGLPAPALVVVLDVPVSKSFRRKRTGRDVHEKDRIFLEKVRRSYKRLAKKLKWRTVDGTGPPKTVQAQISKLVEDRFRQKSPNQ